MGYERKTNLTQRNIRESLIALLEHTKFDLITVNQIVEQAEVTRSTFYRYYEDKYDLLSEIEEMIVSHINDERIKLQQQFPGENIFNVEMYKQIFQSLEPYSLAIQRLLGRNGDSSFEMKLKNEIAKRFFALEEMQHVSKVRGDLVREYVFVILIKTFQYWSNNKDHIDIDEVAATLRDIQLVGLKKAIGL
ncbi:AcrR family transcriptional regulator [Staphylococcus auricularis]|uniref:TetR/AcrR family transcriptional regulator n=2 Tax=Staphylococcus auricularis TaxID=29379 RepID=A0AAP8TT40_9STAP|nr:TetR/AcrR family transcriptional regulator [Staphylococcus auricularis]MDC6327415.1 TetR/AcrR family transcriptional regulator [Staphylococcus auricularis]MDN4534012.1 TetR/AcrR family transcriptional regulator [Staphylococcus auricularis]PNZ67389.1 TetR/AcrR family transcriptional regulator [Staphylococcus auricularis]QPT05956.1 TetR/AcrR family transcriptional regulator [Staphylococcus auricularis]SQJ07007.1 bacterial regulatory s, tetR family protein [Staphylococcus auricularis]